MISINDIQKAIDNANACLHSIYPNYIEPNNINIKFTKAKSYWAMINQSTSKAIGKHKDFDIKIGLLFDMIPDEKLRTLRLEECMIHELIHTIPRCMNHGQYFKKIAAKINFKYPKYNIETQTCGDKFGLQQPKIKYNYEIICSCCGHTSYRCRKLKNNISEYMCARCGSDNLKIKKI